MDQPPKFRLEQNRVGFRAGSGYTGCPDFLIKTSCPDLRSGLLILTSTATPHDLAWNLFRRFVKVRVPRRPETRLSPTNFFAKKEALKVHPFRAYAPFVVMLHIPSRVNTQLTFRSPPPSLKQVHQNCDRRGLQLRRQPVEMVKSLPLCFVIVFWSQGRSTRWDLEKKTTGLNKI